MGATGGASTDRMEFRERARFAEQLVILGSCLFLLGGGGIYLVVPLRAGVEEVLFLSASVLLAAAGGGWAALGLKRLRRPRLVLSSAGIRDARFGDLEVPWSDVANLTRASAPGGHEQLTIELREPDAVLARLGPLRRWWARRERAMGLGVFRIDSVTWRPHDFDRIVSYALLYRQRYG